MLYQVFCSCHSIVTTKYLSMPVYTFFAFVLSLLIVVEGSTTPLNSQHVLFDVDTAHHPNVNSIEVQTSNSGKDLDTAAKNVKEAPAASCTCARRERATIGESEKNVTCSTPWLIPICNSNGSTTACECGSSLGGVVLCNSTTQEVIIQKCFVWH